MFVVMLEFSGDRDRAARLMDGHNDWLRRGFDDGIFVLSGALRTKSGGGILAHNTSLDELRSRVGEDPFVVEGVVRAEILEIAAARADERLAFLLGEA